MSEFYISVTNSVEKKNIFKPNCLEKIHFFSILHTLKTKFKEKLSKEHIENYKKKLKQSIQFEKRIKNQNEFNA